MKSQALFFSILGVFLLAGCEGTQMYQYNPFGQKAADPSSVHNVQMRNDTGNMITPFPPASPVTVQGDGAFSPNTMDTGMANNSVIVNDPGFVTPPMGAVGVVGMAPPPTPFGGSALPNYGVGVSASDPSVTIFPVEGSPAGVGGMSPNYFDQSMNAGQGAAYGGDNQIFFRNGSSRLGGGDMNKLSNVAEQAKFAPVNRITVAGYASKPSQAGVHTVEGHILNLKESMNRSFAVSKTLMRKGVPAEKIKTVSWGATKASGNNAQDRRVDVIMGEQ